MDGLARGGWGGQGWTGWSGVDGVVRGGRGGQGWMGWSGVDGVPYVLLGDCSFVTALGALFGCFF